MYNDLDESFKNALIESSIRNDFLIMEDRKFVDISYISHRQYTRYKNWVDMVTVMGTVSSEVVKGMSGVMLVANMSNNKKWDYTIMSTILAKECQKNVLGFITQTRIEIEGMISMTPGISLENNSIADQKYRNAKTVDTDIIIVGRGIYNYEDYITKAKAYSLV
jgi:orotidine-5'-phosphate decarboxylase